LRVFKLLASGEFLFAAFLLANVFKSALPELPVDLNIIFLTLTILIALKRLTSKPYVTKKAIHPILLFMGFVFLGLVSLIYSSSEVYGVQKILLLSSLTLWSLIGPFLLIDNKTSLKKFLKSFMAIAIATSTYVLFDYFTSSDVGNFMRFGVDGTNSIGLGRAAALGAIVIIMLYLFNTNVLRIKKIFSLAGLATLILVLFLTGSRMALISLGVAMVIFLLVKTFEFTKDDVLINKSAMKVTFSLIPIPLLMIPFSNSIQTMLTRLGNLFNDSGFGSYSQRTERFSLAYNVWKEGPIFGDGLGSYAIHYNGIDERYYPHNIILEIVSELGLVGIIVFAALLALPFFLNNIFKSNYLQMCALLMFIYTFLNANTTGDINDNRMMFTFLALLYMYPLFNDDKKVMSHTEHTAN